MSRKSRGQGRPSIERDPAHYVAAVKARFRLLQQCGRAFDDGAIEQILVLAGLLRLLLADKPPLLDRVTKLEKARFIDSAAYDPQGAAGFGLAAIMMDGETHHGSLVPNLDGGPGVIYPTRIFREWWSRDPAVNAGHKRWFTREFVVYEMANTDGLHVDSHLDLDFDSLTTSAPQGFMIDDRPLEGNIASASVRQIAWEVEHTLLDLIPGITE